MINYCPGIDPSLLTSAAFELVQASQALQAVQAVQPLLSSESPPLMTPLKQVTFILFVMKRRIKDINHCKYQKDINKVK